MYTDKNDLNEYISDRLSKQMDFIVEIDKIKKICRQTLLTDGSREENDAEHSWHIAVMAALLSEYAQPGTDISRTIKMVLVHDLVEIDAGDTFCYDDAGNIDKPEREKKAAQRIFGKLPADQAVLLHELWDEFEAKETKEAMFAASLDRIQPLIHNYHTGGHTWKKHDVPLAKVYERNAVIEKGAPGLWNYTMKLIADAVRKGFLKP
jgi:putative hydrolases of HD superfamily